MQPWHILVLVQNLACILLPKPVPKYLSEITHFKTVKIMDVSWINQLAETVFWQF